MFELYSESDESEAAPEVVVAAVVIITVIRRVGLSAMTGPAVEAPGGSDTPAKAPKKLRRRRRKSGPAVTELVYRAVAASQDRKGLSYYAIKKALSFRGYDVEQYGFLVKRAINMLVKKGALIQTKGSGASGSFKVPKPAKKPKCRRQRNPRSKKYPRLRKAGEPGEHAEGAR